MERKIREVIEKYIVDMFGAEADDNNQKFINTCSEEFAELEDHVIDFSKNNINENQLEGFIIYELDSILTEKDSREFTEKSLKEFSKEIYKIVKGENSMKKISCWEDLVDVKLATTRGLSAEVKKADKQAVINIYLVEKATTPIVVIDWMPTLKNVVDILYKFGFDVEYEEKFNLVDFLKASLEPKEFNFNERNFYFTISEYDYIMLVNEDELRTLNCRYFKSKTGDTPHVGATLRNKNITLNQLMDALEELGWI